MEIVVLFQLIAHHADQELISTIILVLGLVQMEHILALINVKYAILHVKHVLLYQYVQVAHNLNICSIQPAYHNAQYLIILIVVAIVNHVAFVKFVQV